MGNGRRRWRSQVIENYISSWRFPSKLNSFATVMLPAQSSLCKKCSTFAARFFAAVNHFLLRHFLGLAKFFGVAGFSVLSNI